MALPVTSLYGSLTGILYVWLTLGVIRKRHEFKVVYGDGGHRMLIKQIAVSTSACHSLITHILA
jgi:uncharacterized membrane protein YecN with MAPEG domain